MKFVLKTTALVFCLIFSGSALADKHTKDYSWNYEEEHQVAGSTEQMVDGEMLDKTKYARQKKARAPEDQIDPRPTESLPPAVRPPAVVDVMSVPPSDRDTVGVTPPPAAVLVEDDPKPRYIPSKVDFPARKVVASVPELDGSFAFLGFGLIAAFIALIKERRRTELS